MSKSLLDLIRAPQQSQFGKVFRPLEQRVFEQREVNLFFSCADEFETCHLFSIKGDVPREFLPGKILQSFA